MSCCYVELIFILEIFLVYSSENIYDVKYIRATIIKTNLMAISNKQWNRDNYYPDP